MTYISKNNIKRQANKPLKEVRHMDQKTTAFAIVGIVLLVLVVSLVSNNGNIGGEAWKSTSKQYKRGNYFQLDNGQKIKGAVGGWEFERANGNTAAYLSHTGTLELPQAVVVGNGRGNPGKGGITAFGNVIGKGFVAHDSITMRNRNSYIHSEGDIMSRKLQGQGNAYACVDFRGALYRSNEPCT
jgi:hypothetical protein